MRHEHATKTKTKKRKPASTVWHSMVHVLIFPNIPVLHLAFFVCLLVFCSDLLLYLYIFVFPIFTLLGSKRRRKDHAVAHQFFLPATQLG